MQQLETVLEIGKLRSGVQNSIRLYKADVTATDWALMQGIFLNVPANVTVQTEHGLQVFDVGILNDEGPLEFFTLTSRNF